MNRRSGFLSAILILLLLVIILFQVLSMIQSDRLYERINQLAGIRTDGRIARESSDTYIKAEKDRGDWLVWHLSGEPRTLNLYSVDSDMSTNYICLRNIHETLFYYDPDYNGVKLEPVLAEGMEVSDDGLEIVIRLKDKIWFSDGVPVTADDVIFTYKTIMDPRIDAEDIRGYYSNIKDVVKVDARTVKFSFNEVYWKTLESIGIFEVFPKHIYQYNDPEEFNKRRTDPVGSGPYIFEKWDVGQQVVLRRNENYWGNKPKLDKLVFRFITNNSAALQALRTHDLDYMEATSAQYDEFSKDPEFKKEFEVLSYWEPSGGFSYIGWNQAREYFRDKKVRLALTMGMNRESIAININKGYSKVISGPFYIHGKQNDPDVKPWTYDPEKARELLDEAGWKDSNRNGIRDRKGKEFRFNLSYPSGSPTAEQIIKALKDDLAKIGIDLIPDPVEWSIFLDKMHDKNFDSALSGWAGTIESDPYQLFHSSQTEGSNYFSIKNNEMDTLIEKARKTIEPDERYELYHRFHRLVHEEQPYTFLFTRQTFAFLDNRFENIKVHSLGLVPMEWYVPKEKQRY